LPSAAWENHLSELADYRKIHGHCNVPGSYSKNSKLAKWVGTQRHYYNLYVKGETTYIMLSRIQKLESLGFEWTSHSVPWEKHFNELADYREIHGHCNVPNNYSLNSRLAKYVETQRDYYKLHMEGKRAYITLSRIQRLEDLGFEWGATTSEDCLKELAEYCEINGHCNVPENCNENPKLGHWVATQRKQYKLDIEGKTSSMTLTHIKELESLGFEWEICGAAWNDRVSALADYRKIHGHCDVPNNYCGGSRLGKWVAAQRFNYKLHMEGKRSQINLPRIESLESLGFQWKLATSRRKETPRGPSLDDDPSLDDEARPVNKEATNSRRGANSRLERAPPNIILRATGYH
jgi:hypothetical protein